ncbi:hypothetical protein J4422_02555 [Candidatus Pacearchaeota archaeon]|nr:hypothetical protein [Candidatus Pacearchaeota archaeon]
MFNCNCKWGETILGVVILIVALWPALLGVSASMWVTVIAAAIIVIHAWMHHHGNMMGEMPKPKRRRR